MVDKAITSISLVLLAGFMGIVVWFVAEPDLTLIVVLVLAMALYDMWRSVWRSGDKNNGGDAPE